MRVQQHSRFIAGLLAGAGAVAVTELMRDRRRRNMARDRGMSMARRAMRDLGRNAQHLGGKAKGAAMQTASPVRQAGRDYDDVTLARKVETEILGPADAPKGISVSAHDGIVELRGQVDRPEHIGTLGDRASKVSGVRRVDNLLHTPGTPPRTAPVSTPDEVRARMG